MFSTIATKAIYINLQFPSEISPSSFLRLSLLLILVELILDLLSFIYSGYNILSLHSIVHYTHLHYFRSPSLIEISLCISQEDFFFAFRLNHHTSTVISI